MKNLTKLLNDLLFTTSSNKKIEIIVDYLNRTPEIDRGYAIAMLCNNLKFEKIKNSFLKKLVKTQVDPYLFDLSYDYVGDLAETIALIWDTNSKKNSLALNELVIKLEDDSLDIEKFIYNILNESTSDERWTFVKLLLGGLRVGVSESIVKRALSLYGKKPLSEIEKIWNGIDPPYKSLFCWLDDKTPIPKIDKGKVFHPLMLAHSIDENKELKKIKISDYLIEYKWDGIRVQVIVNDNNLKIFSRSGEDITESFPEITINYQKLLVLDGELLVGKNFREKSFNDLQKRINKKKPSKKMTTELPAFLRLYDILFFNGVDLRNKSLLNRKEYLSRWYNSSDKNSFDLSPILNFKNLEALKNNKSKLSNSSNIEGFMIKKKNSLYVSGRKKGLWYKWKRDPRFLDAILMYAQRGHGKRSSYYSDYTLGVWESNKIVPIAKAYSGYTDQELTKIDNFIRNKTISKYGPVREIEKKLVMEIAFDSINVSNRHKSGFALRFPRIHRVRWDKPIEEVMDVSDIKEEFFKK
ncbi:MAG: ATP-dependent DNA ligase [Rickettsiales bacterium]|nr:ATP-dependent DNA ligase [Rickettsiales bacterium]